MTKKELKAKYHGQAVSIAYPMSLGNFNAEREVAAKLCQLKNCCKELGLKVTELPAHATMGLPKKLVAITDPESNPVPYSSMPTTPMSFEEFALDFDNYTKEEDEEKSTKVRKLLEEFKIECPFFEKKSKNFTSTNVVDEGFIQGYTSNEASLWWHSNGRRVFFVRGEGAYELGEKGEENA